MAFCSFSGGSKREVLAVTSLISFFLVTPLIYSTNPGKISTVDALGPGRYGIDDIGDWDRNDTEPEVVYYRNDTVFAMDRRGDRDKISTGTNIKDVEGFYDWNGDGDIEAIWSLRRGGFKVLAKDYLNHQITIARRDYTVWLSPITYGRYNNSEGLFIHFKTKSKHSSGGIGETVRSGSNFYFIPIGHYCSKSPGGNYIFPCPYQLYRDTWHLFGKYSHEPKALAIADLDNDNESELLGIDSGDHLVWYDFYNSSENKFMVNAFELMDETYDVDHDGLEEVFYVTPQEKLAWIDMNRENRVTGVNASKLGGVGNWDSDGFRELSFISPQGNVSILELYDLLVTKRVPQKRLELNEPMGVEIKIDNNRRKNASSLSISDSFPQEFKPLQSGEIEVNITKVDSNGSYIENEPVEVNLSRSGGKYKFSITHRNTDLLEELGRQKKLEVSYRILTPSIPGSYSLPSASVFWQEF